jgi:hypothetical protein
LDGDFESGALCRGHNGEAWMPCVDGAAGDAAQPPDAAEAADASTHDAAEPLDAAHDDPPDGGQARDAAGADAAIEMGDAGTCSGEFPHSEPTCATPELAWDPASIVCSIASGMLELTGQVCDPCGLAGPTYLNETSLSYVACDTCSPLNTDAYVYRDVSYAPNDCQNGELIAGEPLGRPVSALHGASCVEVYAFATSSSASECDVACQERQEFGRLACRCDLQAGTCVSCADGGCP